MVDGHRKRNSFNDYFATKHRLVHVLRRGQDVDNLCDTIRNFLVWFMQSSAWLKIMKRTHYIFDLQRRLKKWLLNARRERLHAQEGVFRHWKNCEKQGSVVIFGSPRSIGSPLSGSPRLRGAGCPRPSYARNSPGGSPVMSPITLSPAASPTISPSGSVVISPAASPRSNPAASPRSNPAVSPRSNAGSRRGSAVHGVGGRTLCSTLAGGRTLSSTLAGTPRTCMVRSCSSSIAESPQSQKSPTMTMQMYVPYKRCVPRFVCLF